nr:lipid droplet-associated hydrolase-like [Chrysemys picta bellii]
MTADMLDAGEESTRSGSEEQVPLYEEFIYCCGAATQVLKCGPWKDLLETESKTLPRLLFLIIPGNPGLAGYYRTFIRALYHGLNRRYPVWVVSHAGHCKPPNGMGMTEGTDLLPDKMEFVVPFANPLCVTNIGTDSAFSYNDINPD